MDKLVFNAEIKETKAKKTASLDISYRLVFDTENPSVLALGALPADKILKVTIEVEND